MSEVSKKNWLTPEDVASKEDDFCISKPTQARLRGAKKIPYVKMGRQIRYERAKLVEWMQSHEVVS